MNALLSVLFKPPTIVVTLSVAAATYSVTIFREEIKEALLRFFKRMAVDQVVGDWGINWTILVPSDHKTPMITDIVRIKRGVDGRITGESMHSRVFDYDIVGFAASTNVSFSFRGRGKYSDWTGVVFMQRDGVQSRKMSGHWTQYVDGNRRLEGTLEAERKE